MERSRDELLTLGEAAKITPGRPSTNAIWRWCRKGVLARSGERVHLEHRRVGGRIFTSERWVDEFGQRLADADTEYFGERAAEAEQQAARCRRRRKRCSRTQEEARLAYEQAVRELEAEGL